MERYVPTLFCITLVLAGCSGAPPPVASEPTDTEPVAPRKRTTGLSMSAEIGALNESKVEATFRGAFGQLQGCYAKAMQRVPFAAGDVRLAVRVTESGSARWAYVKDSNLGERTAESCMVDVLKGLQWPQPEGGEGLAEKSFSFEPGGDERPPLDWSEDKLGKKYDAIRSKLSTCRKSAHTGPIKATMYVETNGKPKAVGLSGADEKVEAAAACVIAELEKTTFASPGSYAAKVTFSIE